MTRHLCFPGQPLAGLILLGFISAGFIGVLPAVLRFVLVFGIVFLLPGFFLLTRFFRFFAGDRLVQYPLCLFLGVSVMSILTGFCIPAGMSFTVYVAVLQILLFVFYAFVCFVDRRRPPAAGPVPHRPVFDSPAAGLLYGALAVALGLFFLFQPAPIDYNGDHYDHIGYIRLINCENELSPDGVLAEPAGEDTPEVRSDPRKGTFHPLLAAVAVLADLSPQDVWRYLPVFLAPAAVLAFLVFSVRLLPPGGYRFACLVLFLLFQGGFGLAYLSRSGYGQNLAMMFYWLLVYIELDYAGSRRPVHLLLGGILLAGGGLIHISLLSQLALFTAAVVVFFRYFDFGAGQRWRLAVGTTAVAALVLVWKLPATYQTGNVLHVHPQGLLYFGEGLFTVSPVEILKRYGLVFLGGICLIPFLPMARFHRREARVLFALSVFPLLLCFVPYLTPLLYGRAAYLVHRLVESFPGFQMIVLVLGTALFRGRTGRPVQRILAALFVFVWSVLFLVPSLGAIRHSPAALSSGRSEAPDFEELVRYFNRKAPRNLVVAADPITGYRLSAYAGVKVVAVLHQHGNPNDPLALDRLRAVRDILSPLTTQEEALAAIHRYGVNYIVYRAAGPPSSGEFLVDWDPRWLDAARRKFDFLPKSFENVFENAGYIVYRKTVREPPAYTWYPENPYLFGTGGGDGGCGARIFDGAVSIANLAIQPARVLPGDRITLRLVYEKTNAVDYGLPLILHIRFDHEQLMNRERRYPGEKYIRRLEERLAGTSRRFRVDHPVFGGAYAPDLWPIGSQVAEELAVDLPRHLRTGTYWVRLKLSERTLVPNHGFRDFLYDEDGYSGPVCGSLVVSSFIVE